MWHMRSSLDSLNMYGNLEPSLHPRPLMPRTMRTQVELQRTMFQEYQRREEQRKVCVCRRGAACTIP